MSKFRGTNVENDENQSVPEILVHKTLDGEAVGKMGFARVGNMEVPDSPTEETFLGDLPLSTKTIHTTFPHPSITSTLLIEDKHEVQVRKSKRKLFTLCNTNYPHDIVDVRTEKRRRRQVISPKKTSDMVFQELYESFLKSRSEDKEQCTPEKPAYRNRPVCSKKNAPPPPGYPNSDGSGKRRKKTIKSKQIRKPKTSQKSSNLGVERLARPNSPDKVNVLQHVIISTDKQITPINCLKRLSVIKESSQEASPLRGVMSVADSDKENVAIVNPPSKTRFENQIKKDDCYSDLYFLRDLEILKINLEYMQQMASMLGIKYEEQFNYLLQSVVSKSEVAKK